MKTTLSCGRLFLTFAHYHLAAFYRPHECMKCMYISVCREKEAREQVCRGEEGGATRGAAHAAPPSTVHTLAHPPPAQPLRRHPRLPRETVSSGSQASVLFLRLLLVLGPWLAWSEVKTPWKIRQPLKGRLRPQHSEDGVGE